MLKASLLQTLNHVSQAGVDATCVHMIRECLQLAQVQSGLHISVLPVDVHTLIAQMICERLSARTLCKQHLRLRTFCSAETLKLLWQSLHPRMSKPRFNMIYAEALRVVDSTASQARETLKRENENSDFMVLLQQDELSEQSTSLDDTLTDAGKVVAWIESNAPIILPIEDAIDSVVEASAHRCMMKKDAKHRFGTYAPYERQDFISIFCPDKRVTWVIDKQPICSVQTHPPSFYELDLLLDF